VLGLGVGPGEETISEDSLPRLDVTRLHRVLVQTLLSLQGLVVMYSMGSDLFLKSDPDSARTILSVEDLAEFVAGNKGENVFVGSQPPAHKDYSTRLALKGPTPCIDIPFWFSIWKGT
jgi:hypothetical protein